MRSVRKLLFVGLDGVASWNEHPLIRPVGIVDAYRELGVGDAGRDGGAGEDGRGRGRRGSEGGNGHPPLPPLPAWLAETPVYGSVEEALERGGARLRPDAALVSVPNDAKTTVDAEALLLREGIDVLAGKLRLEAAEDIDRLRAAVIGAAAGARLYVGEPYRDLPQVGRLKALLAEGRLGQIASVTWRCRLPYENLDWMRSYRHLALEDMAYHHFAILHELLGLHPTRLYAQSFEPAYSGAGTRSAASVLAETEEGYRLNYQTVWCSKRKPFGYLGEALLEGEQGSAVLSDEGLVLYSYFGRRKNVACGPGKYEGPWALVDRWLGASIDRAAGLSQASAAAPFTFEDFEPVLRTIYMAVGSAETGKAAAN